MTADLSRAGLRNGRQPVLGANGIVVTPHARATLAGIDVLRSGGNAVDAALAVSGALMVVAPYQCGPGGDAFWMIRPDGGPAEVLNASGRSSRHASAAEARDRGLDRIPERSALAVTIPSAVAGWTEVHARLATRDLDELLRPAIDLARDGIVVTPHMEREFALAEPLLAGSSVLSHVYRPLGRRLRTGDRLVQRDLATTLTSLAADPRSLYSGDLADRMAEAVGSRDGWLAVDDLATVDPSWMSPLQTTYWGWDVLEAPPNSQGLVALLSLAIRDVVAGDRGDGSATTGLHLWVEAARLSMTVRDCLLADEAAMPVGGAALLEPDLVQRLGAVIDPARALPQETMEHAVADILSRFLARTLSRDQVTVRLAKPAAAPDTVHFVVVDRSGMAVSCIQSLFSAFGSGILVPETGILLHSRGAGFNLVGGHPNELAPSKRPLHTLAPAMASTGGRLAAAFGCQGGHIQTHLHLQMIEGLVERRLDPAAILERPRWALRRGGPQDEVRLESRHRGARGLERLGHRVQVVGPYDQQMGHAQIVSVDGTSGAMLGASDPRTDGLALAL